MKKVNLPFHFHHKIYVAEVSKIDVSSPIRYTAYILDDQLRSEFHDISFFQENNASPLVATDSSTDEEKYLKEILLQRIINQNQFFDPYEHYSPF